MVTSCWCQWSPCTPYPASVLRPSQGAAVHAVGAAAPVFWEVDCVGVDWQLTVMAKPVQLADSGMSVVQRPACRLHLAILVPGEGARRVVATTLSLHGTWLDGHCLHRLHLSVDLDTRSCGILLRLPDEHHRPRSTVPSAPVTADAMQRKLPADTTASTLLNAQRRWQHAVHRCQRPRHCSRLGVPSTTPNGHIAHQAGSSLPRGRCEGCRCDDGAGVGLHHPAAWRRSVVLCPPTRRHWRWRRCDLAVATGQCDTSRQSQAIAHVRIEAPCARRSRSQRYWWWCCWRLCWPPTSHQQWRWRDGSAG